MVLSGSRRRQDRANALHELAVGLPGVPARSRPARTSRAAAARAGSERGGPRHGAPAPRPRPGRRGGRRAQVVRAAHRLEDRKGIRWTPPVDVPAAKGRADSGDLELDLIELFTDVADLARDLGVGVGVFIDEMQDISRRRARRALRSRAMRSASRSARWSSWAPACRTCRSRWRPASRTPSGCSATSVVDRLPRDTADRALIVPADTEDVDYDDDALDELYALTDGYPYFVQAYGKVAWDAAATARSRSATSQWPRRGPSASCGRLLRRPLRPRHARGARLHAHDGRLALDNDDRCTTADRLRAGPQAAEPLPRATG